MLVQTVKHYLQRHKRLVVPQLGAFIVKEPEGIVLFSELLRRDDGVLRGLLTEGGMNELEAAGAIDRFVFEIRHAVQDGADYPMAGFGRFRPGPNDTLAFVFEPAGEPDEKQVPEPAQQFPAAEQPRTGAGAAAAAAKPAERPCIGTAATVQPDPTLKGLRYGKPLETAAAYAYAQPRAKRKPDRFLLVAILAAAIAVAAIAFGYYVGGSRGQRAETERMEPLPSEIPTPEAERHVLPSAAPSTQIPER